MRIDASLHEVDHSCYLRFLITNAHVAILCNACSPLDVLEESEQSKSSSSETTIEKPEQYSDSQPLSKSSQSFSMPDSSLVRQGPEDATFLTIPLSKLLSSFDSIVYSYEKDNKEKSDLQKQNVLLHRTQKSLESTVARLQDEKHELKGSLEERYITNEKLRSELTQYSVDTAVVASLKVELSEAKHRVSQLTSENSRLKSQVSTLGKDLNDSKVRLIAANKECAQYKVEKKRRFH